MDLGPGRRHPPGCVPQHLARGTRPRLRNHCRHLRDRLRRRRHRRPLPSTGRSARSPRVGTCLAVAAFADARTSFFSSTEAGSGSRLEPRRSGGRGHHRDPLERHRRDRHRRQGPEGNDRRAAAEPTARPSQEQWAADRACHRQCPRSRQAPEEGSDGGPCNLSLARGVRHRAHRLLDLLPPLLRSVTRRWARTRSW